MSDQDQVENPENPKQEVQIIEPVKDENQAEKEKIENEEEKKEDVEQEGEQDAEQDEEPEGHTEAAESDSEILNRIFMGEFENLPPQTSKLVRIFTSSTFTGTISV